MTQALVEQLPGPAPITVTKRLVLREYDAMSTAAERVTPYRSPVVPVHRLGPARRPR